jgi:hypothetical protein
MGRDSTKPAAAAIRIGAKVSFPVASAMITPTPIRVVEMIANSTINKCIMGLRSLSSLGCYALATTTLIWIIKEKNLYLKLARPAPRRMASDLQA